jgi:hypothetical protein
MIQSFFFISRSGYYICKHLFHHSYIFTHFSNREPIIEKHWRGITSRSVCDFFWEEVSKYDSREVYFFKVNTFIY